MYYDFIVIGGGYGGLVGAAYLSKQGHHVAVLEKHSTLGGCAGYFKRKGFKFEVGATTINGLGEGGVLEQLISDFQIDLRFARQEPSITFKYGNETLRRYSDSGSWANELSRVCGDYSIEPFCRMIEHRSEMLWKVAQSSPVPPQNLGNVGAILKNGLFNAGSAALGSLIPFSKLIPSPLKRNSDFVSLINEQLLISAQGYMDDVPENVGVLGLGYPSDLYYPVGGISCLAESLSERIKFFGNDVSTNDGVKSVRKILGGYEVVSRKEVRKCRKIVFALPVWNVAQLLDSDDFELEKIRSLSSEEDSKWGAVTLYFGAKFQSEPDSLYYQVHFPVDYPEISSGSIFVSLSAVGDFERAPAGYRAITISAHVKTSEFDLDRRSVLYSEKKRRLEEILLSQFNEAFQVHGIDDIVELSSGTPLTFKRFTSRYRGSVGGIPWKTWQPIWKRIGNRLPLDDLYLLGDTALPGQGIAGVALGARHFAQQFEKKSSSKAF